MFIKLIKRIKKKWKKFVRIIGIDYVYKTNKKD